MASASKQKGILGIAGACCSSEVVPKIEAYLKKWYGYRMSQGVSLLAVLANIDELPAIQALLRIASRHRTPKFRKEAYKFIEEIAERNNWTIQQLEDRTIPTGGFDDHREMEMDYGSRKFTAVLMPDLKVVVRTMEDKVLKSTPQPGANDDEEKAKEAKKALSSAKKEVKQVISKQNERLFEAMITEKQWDFGEWDTYYNHHPIMSSLCQGLVWTATREGEPPISFRPLDDMSLSDVADNEVILTPEHKVQLSHSTKVRKEEAKAWEKHFKEYKLKPTIQQFGKEPFELPSDMGASLEISDFDNHVLNCRHLGQKLKKHGFLRGPDEGDGYFFTYCRKLRSIDMEVVVEFSGCQTYLLDDDIALRNLHFTNFQEDESYLTPITKIPLGKVPPILLSESYNQIKEIASKAEHNPEFEGRDKPWRDSR